MRMIGVDLERKLRERALSSPKGPRVPLPTVEGLEWYTTTSFALVEGLPG